MCRKRKPPDLLLPQLPRLTDGHCTPLVGQDRTPQPRADSTLFLAREETYVPLAECTQHWTLLTICQAQVITISAWIPTSTSYLVPHEMNSMPVFPPDSC